MAKRRVRGEKIILRFAVEGEGFGGLIRQQIRAWGAAGMDEQSILNQLETQLQSGGRLFEQFMNGLKNVAGETMSYISEETKHEQWTGPDRWTWIAIKDANTCDDCLERHGQTKTWAEWEAAGMPGSGSTACRWRCRCTLEPREYGQHIDLALYLPKE